ncbi:MAG TPA: DUF420 domain-containing protein [Cyclobacteriaceae bacterium]
MVVLLSIPDNTGLMGSWVKILPHLNGVINSLTCITLIVGLVAIKRGDQSTHKKAMITSFSLGAIFLISYVIYHFSVESTVYGDINGDGSLSKSELVSIQSSRGIYLFVLISHILLSIGVVPLVLFSILYAITGKFGQHKKIVRYTWPIWFYVSLTGVITYLLISPYYQ